MRWLAYDTINAGLMIVTGVLCGLLAAQIVSFREALAMTVGYSICAVGVTIRDHLNR